MNFIEKVLFLGCNSNQIPYMLEIRRQGYYIVGVDVNKDCNGIEFCDKFYNVGYNDFDELINIGILEHFTNKSKIFTASAQFAYAGAATFANYFNIVYPKLEKINFCLDKVKYYEYFKQNNIPIPKTFYIRNKIELFDVINLNLEVTNFYLKSDYSKNPNYVYRLNKNNIDNLNIFWGNDRYLRDCYILQEEFIGTSLRINVYGNRFNVIDFETGKKTNLFHMKIAEFNVIQILKKLISYLGMENWLLKFDIILNDSGFVLIDIGLDPPSRMLNFAMQNNINFHEHYINQYLNYDITYPLKID